jgi:hypothetical protein
MDQIANLLNNLKDYFNDFIGAVIPGTVLLGGASLLFGNSINESALTTIWAEWAWLPALAAIVVCGHLVLGLFFALRRGSYLPDTAKHSKNEIVQAFRTIAENQMTEKRLQKTNLGFHDLRSLAMSTCDEAADIGRRFMFISLFCYGSGTALVVLAVLAPFSTAGFNSGWRALTAILLLSSGWIVMQRGREFERRAYLVPFTVAIATLVFSTNKPATRPGPSS